MLLHEAVRKARKDLGLSQKRLAELAGIQRRQLATLEGGGNVTLATVRKVIAQLPNLESFTLDGVRVEVTAEAARKAGDELFAEAMAMFSAAMAAIAARMREGAYPGPEELEALRRSTEMLEASKQAHNLAAATMALENAAEEGEP